MINRLNEILQAVCNREVSQRYLSKKANVSHGIISYWLNSKKPNPGSAKLEAVYCALLKIREERQAAEKAGENFNLHQSGGVKMTSFQFAPNLNFLSNPVVLEAVQKGIDLAFILFCLNSSSIKVGQLLMSLPEQTVQTLFNDDLFQGNVDDLQLRKKMLENSANREMGPHIRTMVKSLKKRFEQNEKDALVIADDLHQKGIEVVCLLQWFPQSTLKQVVKQASNSTRETVLSLNQRTVTSEGSSPFLQQLIEHDSVYDTVRFALSVGLVTIEDFYTSSVDSQSNGKKSRCNLSKADIDRALKLSLSNTDEINSYRFELDCHKSHRNFLFTCLVKRLEKKEKQTFIEMLANAGANQRLLNAVQTGKAIDPVKKKPVMTTPPMLCQDNPLKISENQDVHTLKYHHSEVIVSHKKMIKNDMRTHNTKQNRTLVRVR